MSRKSRKYAKNEITKGNVLKFVEALLALAYGEEISIPEGKLENTFKIEWVGKDAKQLFVSGEKLVVTSKRTGQKKPRELGTTRKDLWVLMKEYWHDDKALRLPKNKDNNTPVNYQKWHWKTTQAFQDIFTCLTDLGIFKYDRKHKKRDTHSRYCKFYIQLEDSRLGDSQHQPTKKQQLEVIKALLDEEFGLVDEYPLPDEKNKPEQPSDTQDLKLYEALLKLDYSKQQSLFDEFVIRHQIGACLIHGSEECSPRWLMNRLVQQVPNGDTSNYVRKISFSRNTQNGRLDSICKEISRKIRIPSTAIPEISQKICQLWRSQTVILIFDNTHNLEEADLETFLEKFWQPIADLAWKTGTTNYNYRLLLFLLDLEGCTNDWDIPCTQEITPEWHPRTLIKFKEIEPIPPIELSCWLEQHLCDRNLPAKPTIVEEILAQSEGKHQYIMEEICERYNTTWEEQESKWLKY